MLQFDLNLTLLLKEVPFVERIGLAAQLGFGAVEFMWPGGENLQAIAQAVHETGIRVALMNFDAGTIALGERGFLNVRSKQQWFRSHALHALDFAVQIGCLQLNALVGNLLPDVSREEQLDCVRENLAWVADRASEANLGIVVESLNSFETPHYLLTNTRDTLQLLASVNRTNLKYQYDIYHMQRMEGNIISTLREYIGRIGHIQIADSPTRHEPGTGEIHYLNVLSALDTLGYHGYVGLEYNPTTTSEASFAWLPAQRKGPIAVSDLRL